MRGKVLAAGLLLTLVAGCGRKAPAVNDPGNGDGSTFGSAHELANAVAEQSKAKQSARMTFETSSPETSTKGEGVLRLTGDDIAIRLSMTMPEPGVTEIVLVDRTLYLKLPPRSRERARIPADKPWAKVAPRTEAEDTTRAIGGIREYTDPTKALDQLKQAGKITRTAKEQLDGMPVTHYWLELDIAKMAGGQEHSRQLAELARQAGVRTIDLQLWVQAGNLPAKITLTIDGPEGKAVRTTHRYTDWGLPVDITAPPADQIGKLGLK